jgi:hypothetical protein
MKLTLRMLYECFQLSEIIEVLFFKKFILFFLQELIKLEARREIKRVRILGYKMKHFCIIGYETGAFSKKKSVFCIAGAKTYIFFF